VTHVFNDLLKGGYAASHLFNEQQQQYRVVTRWPEDYFSPAELAAEGVR